MQFQHQRNITCAFISLSSCESKVQHITAYFKHFLFWRLKCQCDSPNGNFCCAIPGWYFNRMPPSFHIIISISAFVKFLSNSCKYSLWLWTGSYFLTICFEHCHMSDGTVWYCILWGIFDVLLSSGSLILFSLKCRIVWWHLDSLAVQNTYNITTWKRMYIYISFHVSFFRMNFAFENYWQIWKRCIKENLHGPSYGKKRIFCCSFECWWIIYGGAMFWRDKILPTVLHANLCNVNINSCCTCIIKDNFYN